MTKTMNRDVCILDAMMMMMPPDVPQPMKMTMMLTDVLPLMLMSCRVFH